MKDWADDLAACLGMMFDRGALFDAARVDRAAEVLLRLHPRFRGDIRAKLREQLGVLGERGAVEAIGGEVYRWVGNGEDPATPPAGASARPRPRAAARPDYDVAVDAVLGGGSDEDPEGEAPTARVGKATDVFAPDFADRVTRKAPGRAPAPAPREPVTGKVAALPTGEQFEAELERRFGDAAAAGRSHLHVSAFELHRALAPYPAPIHRMRLCCTVMRGVMTDRDQALTSPPSGQDGPELLIKYALPR